MRPILTNKIILYFRIIGSGTEYRIDTKVVSPSEYTKKLESLGIFTKAKNFLVFQVNYSSNPNTIHIFL